MKGLTAPLLLLAALAVSACASAPEVRPNVSDRELNPRQISPGDKVDVAFGLYVKDPSRVERVYLRGLPENTLTAGTKTDLPVPDKQDTRYRSSFEVKVPAADGHYDLELVIETSGTTYVAQFGVLAIRDTPSKLLHSQFLPGSHASADCALGTKLLTFQYAVSDDNGAADFVGPILMPVDSRSNDFVFYPHWEPIVWMGNKPGLALEKPTDVAATEELVTSEIRINCRMPKSSLFQYDVQGQSVDRLTGKSTNTNGVRARYFVE